MIEPGEMLREQKAVVLYATSVKGDWYKRVRTSVALKQGHRTHRLDPAPSLAEEGEVAMVLFPQVIVLWGLTHPSLTSPPPTRVPSNAPYVGIGQQTPPLNSLPFQEPCGLDDMTPQAVSLTSLH